MPHGLRKTGYLHHGLLSSSEWNARAGILQNWTQSLNPALMRRYEVSSRVNLVKNNDAACAEPVVREAAAGVPNY